MHIFLDTYRYTFFTGCFLRNGNAELYVMHMFHFNRYCQQLSQVIMLMLLQPAKYKSCCCFTFFSILNYLLLLYRLDGWMMVFYCECHLCVVIKEVAHILICLLAICVSPFITHPFKSFVHILFGFSLMSLLTGLQNFIRYYESSVLPKM